MINYKKLLKEFENNMGFVDEDYKNDLVLIFTELIMKLDNEKDFNIATAPAFMDKNGNPQMVQTQSIGISYKESTECVSVLEIHDGIVNELYSMFKDIDTPIYLYQIQVRRIFNPESHTESLSLKIRSTF